MAALLNLHQKITMKTILKKKNQPMSEYTVYSKRNCSYCIRAIELLESKGLAHDVKKIDEDQKLFLELRQRAPSMRTMPVIFRNDQLVGGYQDLFQYLETQ